MAQGSGWWAAPTGHSQGRGQPRECNRIPWGSGCLAQSTAMSLLSWVGAEGHSAPAMGVSRQPGQPPRKPCLLTDSREGGSPETQL